MKKSIIILVLTYSCSLLTAQENNQAIVKTYNTAELKEDFLVWRKKLENKHANLYLYRSKDELDKIFDSMYLGIDTAMTALQFYSYISPLVSIIKDGHNYIHPNNKLTDYYDSHALFFPFHVSYLDKKLWIDMNLSGDTTIQVGTEILSINGLEVDTIMQELFKRMPRDGYNETYPLWILNEWFREFYSYVFDHPTTFKLRLKKSDAIVSTTVNALSKDSILHTRKKLYPDRVMVHENKKAITYSNIDSFKTGILKIYTFDFRIKKYYNQDFNKTIKQIFKEIENNKTQNLILDLRNNQGGESTFGASLLSYLLHKPFGYVKEYYAVRKFSRGTADNRLKKHLLNRTRKTNPKKNLFSGKVFLLINGGSFSNSGIISSVLETNNRAIIIGDEAGGSKTVLTSSFSVKTATTLPNTKIVCDKPDYRTVIRDLELNDGHGVFPTHQVIPTIDDIITNKDVVLEKAILLINKQPVQ